MKYIQIKKSIKGNDTLVYTNEDGESFWGIDTILPAITRTLDFSTRGKIVELKYEARELPQSDFKKKILEKIEIKNIEKYFNQNFFVLRMFLGDEVASSIYEARNTKNKILIKEFLENNPQYTRIENKKLGEAGCIDIPLECEEVVLCNNYNLFALSIRRGEVFACSMNRHI